MLANFIRLCVDLAYLSNRRVTLLPPNKNSKFEKQKLYNSLYGLIF